MINYEQLLDRYKRSLKLFGFVICINLITCRFILNIKIQLIQNMLLIVECRIL